MKRAISLLVVGLLLVMPCSQALAERGGGRGGGHSGGHYRYDNGSYHRDGWIWFGIGAATLTLGAIIASLSPRHEVVVVNGATYYYDDGVYYRPYPGGYVVVQQPVVIQQPVVVQQPAYISATPSNSTGETFVVNIPNSNGTYTPVTLVKRGNGYAGPQGEFYPDRPSIDQLRVLYGR